MGTANPSCQAPPAGKWNDWGYYLGCGFGVCYTATRFYNAKLLERAVKLRQVRSPSVT